MSGARQHVTADDIRKSCPAEIRAEQLAQYPYSYLLFDGLSVRLAAAAVNMGLRANQVTYAGLFFVVAALTCVLYGWAWNGGYLTGALLIHVVLLLDCVDGHVARYQTGGTRFGALLDLLSGILHYSLLPLCLGVSLYASAPEPWAVAFGVAVPGFVWIAAGVIRSVVSLQGFALREYIRGRMPAGECRDNPAGGIARAARFIIEGEALMLAAGALTATVGLVHVGYTLFHAAGLLLLIGSTLRAFRRLDNSRAKLYERP